MDLKHLAWFFEDEVAACQQAFLDRCSHPAAQGWLDACSNALLRNLFAVTHKVLVAQYKLIEADVGFEDFCQSLRGAEIREYLHGRYPGLRPAMSNACAGWLAQACAVFQRFHHDLDAIQSQLLPGDAAPRIERIRFGMGDLHRGGRSVAILSFANGRQLVYKPRDLAMDTHFARILAWANARCGTDLRTPMHLDRGTHGWVEFIDYTACTEPAQVERFYLRMGQLLALLYLLEGTDFHHENIIAAGEHPVLIDLESFFHPQGSGEENAALDTSVLRVGMLPNRLASAGHIPDISGLSDAEGQKGLVELFLTQTDDGTLSLVRSRGVLQGSHNVPMLDGARIELQVGHAAFLRQGFAQVYRAVLAEPAEFSRLVEACAQATVRVLFRHTATYGHLLEESRHPALMASLEATAAHYGLLRIGVAEYPAAAQFVEFEIGDLHRGDVPLFTARADCRHLWYADDACLPDFFACSGMDAVRRRLAALSREDMDRQLWIIDNAFISHAAQAAARDHARVADDDAAPGTQAALDARLLAQARTLADLLRAQMHETDDTASWLVHLNASLDNSRFELIPAFYDLVGGMPGEILFYSQLGQVTGDLGYLKLAHKALRHLKQRLGESSAAIQAVGLYAGWGSLIHLMTALARLESNYDHLAYAEQLLADTRLDRLITADRHFSLMKGTAGFMLACSQLHLASGSVRALELARACAEHLLAHRCHEVPGHAWKLTSAVPLSGLAHGASGFALAFAVLFQASGDARYRDVALGAIEYERRLFHPPAGNWLDRRDFVLRERGEGAWCSVGWAHGAPGIGLARLAMLQAGIDTEQVREELAIALRTTIDHGLDGGDSLIFGNFGNLELLICYAECFGQAAVPELPALVEPLLQRIGAGGLRLNAPTAHPLGLMTGATGVAYQCLRLARMHQVPSVLCGTSALAAATSRHARPHGEPRTAGTALATE